MSSTNNIFNLPSAEQIDELNTNLFNLIIAEEKDEDNLNLTSWSQIQRIVRNGIANKIFAIGDQLICQRGNDTLVWDIIGIDHDTPADPQFTHSLTLQLHDCFPTSLQFDAPEAFYYCETALEAGTYHFTVSGTDYQFTASTDIAAGSQLILGFTSDVPTSITVAGTKGGTVAEGSLAVTAGSGGTALDTDYLNDINRVVYGNNQYKESAIRQWLNSPASAGSVWLPQNNFDRPPDGSANTAGFMNGMDADFLAVIGSVTKVTARNTVTDGGGSDTTTETFFLLSRSEVYGGLENGVDEGAPYPYYANYSKLSSAGIGTDSNRIKYKSGTESPTAQFWWMRSTNSGSGTTVRFVGSAGLVSANAAHRSGGVAPACCII